MYHAENKHPAHSLVRWAAIAVLLSGWALLLFRLDQAPPGLQHDQMFNSRDALAVLRGNHSFYFEANFGREALGIYAAAAVMGLADGHPVWSLRFTSVIWGMLGLAATLALARRYLPPWGALLATALLAGSFGFLFAARLGLEPIALAPLAVLAIYLLDRGLARRSWRNLAAAGALAGLATYTYLASRALFALPILLLLHALLVSALARLRIGAYRPAPGETRFAVAGSLLMGLAMALVSAPLLLYVRDNPAVADRRLGEVGGPLSALMSGDLAPLWQSTRDTLVALVWRAPDLLPYHYNVPTRPVLHPLLGLPLLIGLGYSLWRWRDRREFLLLASLLIGLAPSLLSSPDALYMRSVLALPFIFIMLARGLWQGGRWLVNRLLRPASGSPRLAGHPWALPVLLVLAMLWHAAASSQAYFVDWAQAEPTQRIYNADLRAAAAYVDANAQQGEPVFIGADRLFDLDRLVYELYQPRRSDVRWFHLPEALPLPEQGDALYLLTNAPQGYTATLQLLAPAIEDAFHLPAPRGEKPLLSGFRLSASAAQQALAQASIQPLAADLVYGDVLRLEAAGTVQDGGQASLITVWRALAPWPRWAPPGQPVPPPKVAISLTDSAGYRWVNQDVASTLPHLYWQPGELYLEATPLDLPADLPPGPYAAHLVVYDDVGGPLPVRRNGAFVAAAPQVAPVSVAAPIAGAAPSPPFPAAQSEPSSPLPARGRWEALDALLVDAPFDVHVSWQAQETLPTEQLRFRLTARAPDGQVLWEEPAGPASLPFALWPAGQVYRLTHRIPPQALPDAVDAVRLEVCATQAGAALSCLALGEPQVVRQPPLLALPAPPQHPSGAAWNGQLMLAGYDLAPVEGGADVTLYWHVEQAPPTSLRRFVHALDAGGAIIAQADSEPANGQLPMPFWRSGEYVVDTVRLHWPAGSPVQAVEVVVGFYDPETGERLPLTLPDGSAPADRRLRLGAVGT